MWEAHEISSQYPLALSSSSSSSLPPPPQYQLYIGSFITLVSIYDLRYAGFLCHLNYQDQTLGLQNAICYGTEGRNNSSQVPPSSDVYSYILFKMAQIKKMRVTPPHKSFTPAREATLSKHSPHATKPSLPLVFSSTSQNGAKIRQKDTLLISDERLTKPQSTKDSDASSVKRSANDGLQIAPPQHHGSYFCNPYLSLYGEQNHHQAHHGSYFCSPYLSIYGEQNHHQAHHGSYFCNPYLSLYGEQNHHQAHHGSYFCNPYLSLYSEQNHHQAHHSSYICNPYLWPYGEQNHHQAPTHAPPSKLVSAPQSFFTTFPPLPFTVAPVNEGDSEALPKNFEQYKLWGRPQENKKNQGDANTIDGSFYMISRNPFDPIGRPSNPFGPIERPLRP